MPMQPGLAPHDVLCDMVQHGARSSKVASAERKPWDESDPFVFAVITTLSEHRIVVQRAVRDCLDSDSGESPSAKTRFISPRVRGYLSMIHFT
jgi:hypothetical protein